MYWDSSEADYYASLDSVNNQLVTENVTSAVALRVRIKSADPSYSGNVVMTIGGSDYTVSAATSYALQTVTLSQPYTGALVIEANTSSADWTLRSSGTALAAVIGNLYVVEDID